MTEYDIFEPFERLVEINVLGEKRQVPENNMLLRCFQYLGMKTDSYKDFCWNGDCGNCQIWLADSAKEKTVLACRAKVQDGMRIVRLNEEIKL